VHGNRPHPPARHQRTGFEVGALHEALIGGASAILWWRGSRYLLEQFKIVRFGS